jgi:cold shock CspA family protein/ribosome-associated translation inhibitor RaiA
MQKPLQIAFRGMESSEFLEGLIRDKVARLERLNADLISCRVVVEGQNRKADSAKGTLAITVEVELPGRPLIVARGQEPPHDAKGGQARAVTLAFDAAERQLTDTSAIQDGAVKMHGNAGEAGVVNRLFRDQNYGFVEVRGAPDLYFTRNAVVGGSFDAIEVGTLVEVTVATGEGPMGPQASSVRLLAAERSVA